MVKKTLLPDHTWDQSHVNAVAPMTFFFLETYATHREVVYSKDTVVHTDNIMCITRSSQAITFLYCHFLTVKQYLDVLMNCLPKDVAFLGLTVSIS